MPPELTDRPIIGAAPASLVHVGEKRMHGIKVSSTIYGKDRYDVFENVEPSDLPIVDDGGQRWIQVRGLSDTAGIARICKTFGVHPLVVEDILNAESNPKVEEYEDHIFTSVKLAWQDPLTHRLDVHQISLVLTQGTVISFIEDEIDVFAPLTHRLEMKGSRVRLRGSDYLAYALLDIVADTSLAFIDELEDRLELIEADISSEGALPDLKTVHGTRRQVAEVHRLVRPFRDVSNHFINSGSPLIAETTQPYLRDLHDHAVQAVELTEFLRDHAASLRELYYTTTSHRMNQVMKVLAAISVIFLPLSFLAGVYGMNFVHMPELQFKYGYPILLFSFVLIGSVLAVVFKRKGWF